MKSIYYLYLNDLRSGYQIDMLRGHFYKVVPWGTFTIRHLSLFKQWFRLTEKDNTKISFTVKKSLTCKLDIDKHCWFPMAIESTAIPIPDDIWSLVYSHYMFDKLDV